MMPNDLPSNSVSEPALKVKSLLLYQMCIRDSVYDPQPKGINDVLVVNDRIAAVGKDLNPQIPTIKEIDGSGKTVVPGFIDQHVHVTLSLIHI